MNFVAQYESFGETVIVPLVPNGELIPVTIENKQEYVNKMVDWVMNKSIEKQFDAFKSGFFMVCGGNALSLFRAEEVEMMVCGGLDEIDFEQLQTVTEYEGYLDIFILYNELFYNS